MSDHFSSLLLLLILLLLLCTIWGNVDNFGNCDSTNVRRRLAKEIVTDNVRNDLYPFGN